MKSMAIVRLTIIGFLAAVVLSLVSSFSLNRIMDFGANNHRRYLSLSIATALEDRPLDKSLFEFLPNDKNRPPFPFGGPNGPGGPGGPGGGPGPMMGPPPNGGFGPPPDGPPPGFGGPPPRFGMPSRGGPGGPPRFNMWVVNAAGEIIASSADNPFPKAWREIQLPTEAHDVVSNEGFFKVSPTIYVTKLETKTPAYLILYESPRPFMSGPIFATQALLTFTTVSLAIFFSLFITFLYLRRKSMDAKSVLLRLEKGDLKARFEIKRMDEFGVLMLDFNRMADEIERLVLRIHETEKSRKNLLQELGHDLRTPLTGLTTAYETLKYHFQKINESDRNELFGIMGGEISYLKDLLEKLLTIATLDEPHYKKTTETIDLEDLVGQELKFRQSASQGAGLENPAIKWSFESKVSGEESETVLGDPHLLMRLIRNGLDNAAKYARKEVQVSLVAKERHFEIIIEDDGPGLSPADQESFGKRKDYRARAVTGLQYSIGLGSVIMKTIAELHGGSVEIQNKLSSNEIRGALLKIILPKVY